MRLRTLPRIPRSWKLSFARLSNRAICAAAWAACSLRYASSSLSTGAASGPLDCPDWSLILISLDIMLAMRERGTGGGGGGEGAISPKHLVARTRSSAIERTYTHTARSVPSAASMLFSAAVVIGTQVSAC